MTALLGMLLNGALGHSQNPNLSTNLSGFELDEWPRHESAQSVVTFSAAEKAFPVSANGRALQAALSAAFSDDYYHRIHINPGVLALGNIVSTQSSIVRVWNAFFEPRTLDMIDGLQEGIDLVGPGTPPMLFPALAETIWQVSVTPDGPSVLDARLIWHFDNDAAAVLAITGNRIVAWSFVPDWGDGVLERLTAATDILQSESAASQRRQLRLAPRREFEAPIYADGRERQMLDLALHGWGVRVWALPIWPDIQVLAVGVLAEALFISCSTAYLDFHAGGLAMLRGETAFELETVEIEAVTALGLQLKRGLQKTWPAGTRLYPVRAAQLLERPSLSKLTDTLISAQVHFLVVEASDWPAVMPTSLYRGRPVWDARPDESEDLTHGFEHLLTQLDNGLGMPLFTDTANRALTVLGQRWVEQGRAQRASLRSFIYAMAGRQKVVWVPSHMDDLTLVATVSNLATTLDVTNIGYTRFSAGKPGRRDIRIELLNGTVLMRRVSGSTELDAQVERLTIDSALGMQVEPHQVARISWMVLCRFSSDTQEIKHITDSLGVASWTTVFREERDDEL